MDKKRFQQLIERNYSYIEKIARVRNKGKYIGVIQHLKNVVIKPVPWWWRILVNPRVIASTVHPPIFEDSIFIFKRFWTRGLRYQSGVLCHEFIHCIQRDQGRLNYIKYAFNKEYRQKVEHEAEELQHEFLKDSQGID